MAIEDWIFSEEQRDACCKGELCPRCLGNNITYEGDVPDGVDTNSAYKCETCNEAWEGY